MSYLHTAELEAWQVEEASIDSDIKSQILDLFNEDFEPLEVEVEFEIYGEYYPATTTSPVEYPEIEIEDIRVGGQVLSPEIQLEIEEMLHDQDFTYDLDLE